MKPNIYAEILVLFVFCVTALSFSWHDKTVTGLLVSPGDIVPGGYGAPYNIFTNEQVLNVVYTGGKIYVSVEGADFVWPVGYYYDSAQKKSVAFALDGFADGKWIAGDASAVVDASGLRSKDNYVYAYFCLKNETLAIKKDQKWWCGCGNQTNTTCRRWQVQTFDLGMGDDNPPPPGDFGECGNGIVEKNNGEECDGTTFAQDKDTCQEVNSGFSGGTLKCYDVGSPNRCKFDTSLCTGTAKRYKCSGSSCVEDAAGTYTTSTCNNACSSLACRLTSAKWQLPASGGTGAAVAKLLKATGMQTDYLGTCDLGNACQQKTSGGTDYTCYEIANSAGPGWVPASMQICTDKTTTSVQGGGCHAAGKSIMMCYYNDKEAELHNLPVVSSLGVSGCTLGGICQENSVTDGNWWYSKDKVPGTGTFWVQADLMSGDSAYTAPDGVAMEFSITYTLSNSALSCSTGIISQGCPGITPTSRNIYTENMDFIKSQEDDGYLIKGQLRPGKMRIASIAPATPYGSVPMKGGDSTGPFDFITIASPPLAFPLTKTQFKKGETVTLTGTGFDDGNGQVGGKQPTYSFTSASSGTVVATRGYVVFDLDRKAVTEAYPFSLKGGGYYYPAGYAEPIYYCNDGKIEFNVPSYLANGKHTATFFNVFGLSNSMEFTVETAQGTPSNACQGPVTAGIDSFTPAEGKINDIVVIKGWGFVTPNTVKFNGVAATVLAENTENTKVTEIQARVPAGATTGLISVTPYGKSEVKSKEQFIISSGSGTLPGKATLISPSGKTTETKPQYNWNAASGAEQYNLNVHDKDSADVVDKWYKISDISCSSSKCTANPGTGLASGDYEWWIQAWNTAGYGGWSEGMKFTIGTETSNPITIAKGKPINLVVETQNCLGKGYKIKYDIRDSGNNAYSAADSDISATVTRQWTPTLKGNYKFRANLYDSSGNQVKDSSGNPVYTDSPADAGLTVTD